MISGGQSMVIWQEDEPIPSDLFWFDVAGQKIFPFYGLSGGLTCAHVAFLMDRCPLQPVDMGATDGLYENGEGRWYTIKWDAYPNEQQFRQKIKNAVKALHGNG